MTSREAVRRLRAAWRRARGWRRLRFTPAGAVFTMGACAVGFAAVNTGNNLLHLLLGAMLGLVVVSGWVSERSIRHLEVRRELPHGAPAGQEARVAYHVTSRGRSPAVAVEIRDSALPEAAFLARADAGETVVVRAYPTFARRGVHALETITVSTGFPFGLFVKERDFEQPGELVVWPRTDRPVRLPPAGGAARGQGAVLAAGMGMRGDYRALRGYRPGDDVRDIHWRTSARLQAPVVREFETEVDEALWLSLDTRRAPGDDAEDTVDAAASMAALAAGGGRPFGLLTEGMTVPQGSGPAHLERVLDRLARVTFRKDAPPPPLPPGNERSVPVGPEGAAA